MPPLAVATPPDLRSLALVLTASTLGAVLSRFHHRVVLPSVVVEIVLGILIGQEALGWASVDGYLTFLSNFGLAFLFFFAGLEVVEKRVARRALVLGTAGWGISLALGLGAGAILAATGVGGDWWLLGIAMATTALGTLVPILGDAGLLGTPLGSAILGTGVAGEFWPIVVMSVFLTGIYGAGVELMLLVGFGVVVAIAAYTTLRARPPRLLRILHQTVHTTAQTAVRLSVLTLALLVLIARDVGFDFILGAFAAGLIVGLALDTPDAEPVRMRLEGIGFGLLIPIYFVVTGMTFDVRSLLTVPGLSLAGVVLALLLVVRGSSVVLWMAELGRRQSGALALCAATGLPLIVALVDIGTDRGAIDTQTGASMIGAGMISVLAFPLLATAVAGRREPAPVAEAEPSREF